MTVSASEEMFLRVVQHVFLPPQLPHDEKDGECGVALVDATLDGLAVLRDLLLPNSPPEALDRAIALLRNIKAVNSLDGGDVDELHLQQSLTTLPISHTLAANIRSQNAAVLVTRQPDELVFEEFELSPLAAHVVQTEGRLTRTFPGLAVAVSSTFIDNPDFPKMIANTLSTMCHQEVPGMR
jgi:hypothetical protein